MKYERSLIIEGPRLQLVCCNTEILEAALSNDADLAGLLGINIPEKWTVFGEPAFQYAYTKIQAGENMKWWCYFPVLKAENMLAGSCGYKGEPLNGVVEIGYEVAEKYRGLGLATEMAMLLVMNALKDPAVQCVQAHTLATENESVSVLRKCGFIMREEVNDPDDGNLWRWELAKKKDN